MTKQRDRVNQSSRETHAGRLTRANTTKVARAQTQRKPQASVVWTQEGPRDFRRGLGRVLLARATTSTRAIRFPTAVGSGGHAHALMPCPLCGDVCRCSYAAPSSSDARSRDLAGDRLADEFPSPDLDHDEAAGGRASVLIDPEAWDDSEEQFAASVAEAAAIVAQRKPRVNPARAEASASHARPRLDFESAEVPARSTTLTGIERVAEQLAGGVAPAEDGGDGWRNEVASRVHSYRAR